MTCNTIQSDLVKQSGWSGFGLTTFCTGSSPAVCNYGHSTWSINEWGVSSQDNCLSKISPLWVCPQLPNYTIGHLPSYW